MHPNGHTLIVIGGEYFNDSGAYLLNDVWTLETTDMNSYTWSQPPVQGVGLYRSNHTSILIGDQIWVIAGTNASAKAVDIQLLNVTDWTWSYESVSTYIPPPTDQYQSIGGVKGLVGIVVGVVGAALLASLCIGIWWCRRKRIKPFSKEGKGTAHPSLPIPYHDEQNNDVHDQQMQHNNHRQSKDISAALATSKITSRPSLSTTTSNNNLTADWNNQQPTLTNHPPNINTGNNYYNGAQYSINTPGIISPLDRNQPQYYDNNYYIDNNNIYNDHNYGPGFVSVAPNTAVHQNIDNNGHHRQSFGYWDAPPPQFPR